MGILNKTIHEAIAWYNSGGFNSHSYLLYDESKNAYIVAAVDDSPKRRPTRIVVMARIVGDYVIIEADNTDKPLVDRLVAAGIPRTQIIKYYAGEPLPDALNQPIDVPQA